MELVSLHPPSQPPLTRFLIPRSIISLHRTRFNLTTTRARKQSPTLLLQNQRRKKKKKKKSSPVEESKDDGEERGEEDEVEMDEEERESYLSLSEKPDRTVRVLDDDDEFWRLGYGPTTPDHRSGYVALLGKPNVGKSTLTNQILGQKLCIVTEKPQTTRHRILGICSEPEYQIILYDTPGVIQKKVHKLHSMMMKNIKSATLNADCVLAVVDASKVPEEIDGLLEEGIGSQKNKIPTLLVLNKKDLIKPGEIAKRIQWYEKFANVDDVIPVSAKYGHGVDDIKEWIVSKLPLGPAYFPKDTVSEAPEKFFVGEIVREKIFMQYRNDIPYVCQVHVVSYKSRPQAKDFIQIEILVEKESQKMIVIGKDGRALKLVATAARLDIEDFLEKQVYLEIKVKVKPNWREDEGFLKQFGYGAEMDFF